MSTTATQSQSDRIANRGEHDMGIIVDDIQKQLWNGAGTGANGPSNHTRGNDSTCTTVAEDRDWDWGCNCSAHRRRRAGPVGLGQSGNQMNDLQSEGMGRLARKDVLWYLCSVLHMLLPDETSLSATTATGASESGSRIESSIPGEGRVRDRGSRTRQMETKDVTDSAVGQCCGGSGVWAPSGSADGGGGASDTGGGGNSYSTSVSRSSAFTEDGGGEKGGGDGDGVKLGDAGIVLPPGVDGIRLLREGVLDALLGLIACCQRRDGSAGAWRRSGSDYSNRENARSDLDIANVGGREAGRTRAGKAWTGTETGGSQTFTGSRSSFDIGRRHEGATPLSSLKQNPGQGEIVVLPSVVGELSRLVLDEEEYSMLLGVIERYYWLLSPVVQNPGLV
ncbi:hypothetical protein V5O48_013629 [Marasmius crinis-equi]|uniref:Uncharacterized protein n=1 Tax=Marasmius crinis-equi TaxID=585013 RepID=A0ABR3EZK1_9AGAR